MPRRRPPRVLVAASAVLLAAVVGLWAQSYWRPGAITYVPPGHYSLVASTFEGSLLFLRRDRLCGRSANSKPSWRIDTYRDADGISHRDIFAARTGWYRAGFGLDSVNGAVAAPFWFLALAAALPLAWVVACRRRPPPGHCRSCGYDLTANASGRCPECGTSVPKVSLETSA